MCSTRVSLSKQNTTALSRPRCFVEAFFSMFCALHMLASCLPCIDSPHCGFQDLFHHCSSLSEVSSIQIIFPDPRPTPQEYRRYTTTPNIYIYISIYQQPGGCLTVSLSYCLVVCFVLLFVRCLLQIQFASKPEAKGLFRWPCSFHCFLVGLGLDLFVYCKP
jgi:hypothetical protein